MGAKFLGSCCFASLLIALSSTCIFAAEAEDQGKASPDVSSGGLAEIVVTAQKRSQSINDVPMSIAAINEDTLLERGIRNTADLDKVVPGFTSATSNLGTPVYTLRGIGLYDTGLASASPVSVYIDQNPLPFPVMTIGATLDLERVEVLKGPQGILFGQNSTGGAVNYIAARPTNTFAAGGDVTYERFGKIDAGGFVSGPISDTLHARVAVRAIQGGAWQYSITRPDDRLGDTRELLGRLLLDWDPAERLKVSLNFNGNQNQSDTQVRQLEKVAPTVPAHVDPALLTEPLATDNAREADWTPGVANRVNDDFYQSALRADYDLTESIKLTDLTSYAHQKVHHQEDQDSTPLPLINDIDFGVVNSFNQELRVSSDSKLLHWVLGANYEHDRIADTRFVNYDGSSGVHPIASLPAFSTTIGTATQGIDTSAAFGNLEYKLADQWSIHGGLRYTQANRHAHICQTTDDANNSVGLVFTTLQKVFVARGLKITPVIPIPLGGCWALTPPPDLSPQLAGTNVNLSESNVSWRGGVDYKTDGGALVYANASRGYKSGVITNVIGSSTGEYDPAKQESVDAYEVGFKAPLFDKRVHVNAATFYYEYTDKQVRTRTLDAVFGRLELIQNVPKSRIWGVDVDIQARPIDGLTLSAAGTYLNSRVTSTFNTVNQDGVSGNFVGSRLPYTPALSSIGDAEYKWGIREGMDAFVGGSITYRSSDNTSFRTALLRADDFKLPSYAVLDLRVGVQDDKWRVSFFVNNVTNRYYWTFVFNGADSIGRTAGMPPLFGMTFSRQY